MTKRLSSLRSRRQNKAAEAEVETVDTNEEVETTEEEVVETPKADKKLRSRRSAKKVEETADDGEDEDQPLDEDDTDAEDSETADEVEAPKTTKSVRGRKPAVDKKESKGEAKKTVEDTEKKVAKEENIFKPFTITSEEGSTIKRRDICALLANRFEVSLSEAEEMLKGFEEVFTTGIFPHFSCNLFGTKFKRKEVEERIIVGCGGLSYGEKDDANKVSAHVKITANMNINRYRTKGKVDAKGKFKATEETVPTPGSIIVE